METEERFVYTNAVNIVALLHSGQTRKDKITPFVVHPLRVSALVDSYGGDLEEILAALFHDTVEDVPDFNLLKLHETLMILHEIHEFDVDKVKNIVVALTKNKFCKNRKERNNDAIYRILNGGESAILVKLCDTMDNLNDSYVLDSGFLKIWLDEHIAMLNVFSVCDYTRTGIIDAIVDTINTVEDIQHRRGI